MKETDIQISIIIVNYNVKHFLEQCLNSVFSALNNCRGEVFVVDNNSIDDSMKMVKDKFPQVITIENRENVGFSRANNQAIRISKGKYVLLLNPDTVVEEDTFEKVVKFMDEHPKAGGLGVRMIDGKGRFLPESKRGIPTPAVAFYKIFGLSKLFPKSKRFGRYHLGFLSEFEVNEIEILSGAFMLLRKEALDKVGLLDEDFFMYGEDIDLSYRINLGGYKNYYFPETRIIHYKGESTKKSSVNYVFVFYNAMIIFAKKHFSQRHFRLFSLAINFAIYLRASMAILYRILKRAILPIMDFTFLVAGSFLLTYYWQDHGIYFPQKLVQIALPAYVLLWMFAIYLQGGYDKSLKFFSFVKGVVYGTGFLLIIYALLPKLYQFSRLYIIISSLWILTYFIISRIVKAWLLNEKFPFSNSISKIVAVVGSVGESNNVQNLLNKIGNTVSTCYSISSSDVIEEGQIGRLNQMEALIKTYKIDEVIYCVKDCSAGSIFHSMNELRNMEVEFKLAQPDALYLIGSNSIETTNDSLELNINQINSESNIRNKRLLDISLSFLLLVTFSVHCWVMKNKVNYFSNILRILFGKISFVGYSYTNESGDMEKFLPQIKKGVLPPNNSHNSGDSSLNNKINLIYSRDYSIWLDLNIIFKNFKKLDQSIN